LSILAQSVHTGTHLLIISSEVLTISLMATNVKLDAEKLQLAKLKGHNISQVCRDAIDVLLKLDGDDIEMINQQLVNIEKRMQELTLEKKFLLEQLQVLEESQYRETFREGKYQQYRTNLAFMIKNKTIDWNTQKSLFKFNSTQEVKKWMLDKLIADGLISK